MHQQFLTSIPPTLEAEIRDNPSTTLTLWTTATSPTCCPGDLGGKLIAGRWQKAHYQKLHGGAGFDARARAVVLGVSLGPGQGRRHAFHLATMTPSDLARLVEMVTRDKMIIGYDLAPLFVWLMHIAPGVAIEPHEVVDVMLLARCVYPEDLWGLHRVAAMDPESDGEIVEHARAFINNAEAGDAPGGIDALALTLLARTPPREWKGFHHWMPTALSAAHLEHVIMECDLPRLLLLVMTAGDTGGRPGQDTFDGVWAHMPLALAKITARGIPLNAERATAVQMHRVVQLQELTPQLLKHAPELADYGPTLRAGTLTTPQGLKAALGAYAARLGCTLETGGDGLPAVGAEKALLAGAHAVPGWLAWEVIQKAKKAAALVGEYKRNSAPASGQPGRRLIKSMMSPRAVTMRLSSEAPNAMAMPRAEKGLEPELQVRAVVEAFPGWRVISADYAQIDLRVAAALAQRAIAGARDALEGRAEAPGWVLAALRGDAVESVAAQGLARAWAGLQARGTPMADAFRQGLDPHTITGTGLAARRGTAFGPEDRQAAKAINFGLIYGLSVESLWRRGVVKYGLTWTMADAAVAHEAWFQDYPDMDFWQRWTQAVHVDAQPTSLYRRNFWTKEKGIKDERMRHSTTLSGRPVLTPEKREQLNHADQGTGADVIAAAVLGMGVAGNFIVNLVHDEIVAHAPEHLADAVAADIVRSMKAAASRVLEPWGVPVDVEVTIAGCWS